MAAPSQNLSWSQVKKKKQKKKKKLSIHIQILINNTFYIVMLIRARKKLNEKEKVIFGN